jgi:hypothetical protein
LFASWIVHTASTHYWRQGPRMAAIDTRVDVSTTAVIDRVTQALLAQLELQTQVALVLLERAPEEKRGPFLERLANVRGRLVRLRTQLLGRSPPTLITKNCVNGS